MCGYRCVKHREQGTKPNTCSDINANNIIVNEIGQNGFINQINLFKSNILQKDNDNLIVSTQSNDLKKFNLLLDKYQTFKDLLRKMLDEC